MGHYYIKICLHIMLLILSGLAKVGEAASPSTPSPSISRGQLDLSELDLKNHPPISLSGEWEFYWDQLLLPDNSAISPARAPEYFPVPAIWRGAIVGGRQLTVFGQATYRLRIKLPPEIKQIGLRLPYFFGWAKLLLNGKTVREYGSFDASVPSTQGGGGGYYEFTAVESQDLDIVIQTVNSSAASGGTSSDMLLGDVEVMAKRQSSRLGFDTYIFSTIFFMVLYHGYMFLGRRRELSNLWFACFSLLMAGRSIVVGEGNIALAFLHMPAIWAWRIELITYYLAIPVLAQFIGILYPHESKQRYVNLACMLAIPISLITIVTDSTVFSPLRLIIQSLNILYIFIYGHAIISAIAHHRQGARVFLAGFGLLSVLSSIEIVAINTQIDLPRLSPVGMYLFICFQAILLAKRFNSAFVTVARSEREIRQLNFELKDQEMTRLQLTRVNAERHMLQSSLAEAQAVYTSLGLVAGSVPGMQICSHFQAAEMAGGDWLGISYDQNTRRLYMVIGDVTGHDMLSALVTVASAGTFKGAMAAIQSRREAATMDETLELLVKVMNDSVRDSGRQDHRLMSMALLAIDVSSGDLAYVNAGHTPVLKISDGAIQAVVARANPLGLADDFSVASARLQLHRGDSLFIYTDGLLDNEGPSGGKFRLRHLKDILLAEQDPERVHARILEDCRSIWQGQPAKDDNSFVCIKWNGPDEDALCRPPGVVA